MSTKNILVSSILLACLSVGGLSILLWSGGNGKLSMNEADPTDGQTETVTKRPPLAEPRDPAVGQKEYRNEFHRFQLLYPDDLVVTEEKVSAGTTLITFESTTDGGSFQVFIIPHGDPHITDHRLEKDLPYGVIESQEDIELSGAKGMAFLSVDDTHSPTREVWFIKNGFLYEVTTHQENEVWLSEILTTWMFL